MHIKLAHLQTNVAGAMGPSHLAQHSSALNPFPTYMTNLFGGSNAYFKCRFCTEEFHIEFLLERHLETAHGSEMQSERGSRSPSKERLHKSKESAPSGRTNGQHRDNERRDNKLESCLALPVTLPSSKLNGSSKSARDELNSATLMQGALGGKSASTKCNICDAVCSSLSDLAGMFEDNRPSPATCANFRAFFSPQVAKTLRLWCGHFADAVRRVSRDDQQPERLSEALRDALRAGQWRAR